MWLGLCPIVALFAALVLGVVLVRSRTREEVEHDEDGEEGEGHAHAHHAHPFTIFGYAPQWYLALFAVLGFTYWVQPKIWPPICTVDVIAEFFYLMAGLSLIALVVQWYRKGFKAALWFIGCFIALVAAGVYHLPLSQYVVYPLLEWRPVKYHLALIVDHQMLFSLSIAYFSFMLLWSPVFEASKQLWGKINPNYHYHYHVPHGDTEADTAGKVVGWMGATYLFLLLLMIPHMVYDTTFAINPILLRLVELTDRWLVPGNVIFIIVLANHTRLVETGRTFLVLFIGFWWLFFCATYIYGGYNPDPWDEIWRGFNQHPPGWLQWLFPVAFG